MKTGVWWELTGQEAPLVTSSHLSVRHLILKGEEDEEGTSEEEVEGSGFN